MTFIAEAFSLSHAAILDGSTGAEAVDGDIYGVNEASLEPNVDSFENQGDDTILSIWDWMNYAEVSVQGGYIPFKLISTLTGEPLVSSGAGEDMVWELEPWTDRSFNVSPRPMLVRMPSRDSLGAVRVLDIVLYRVQFAPITFNGPSYKEGLKVNYTGRCLLSERDEAGDSLGDYRSVGRLINRPA